MTKYERFLFYYSLVAISVILVVTLFFNPQPQNFFILAIFTPISLYFFLKVTISEANTYKWSLKFLSILIVIGIMGVLAFYLSQKPGQNSSPEVALSSLSPTPKVVLGTSESENTILESLNEIKVDLSQIKAEQRAIKEIIDVSPEMKDLLEAMQETSATDSSQKPQ